jgi:signal transduction histidine kinase
MVAKVRSDSGTPTVAGSAARGALVLFAILLPYEAARSLGVVDGNARPLWAAFLLVVIVAVAARVVERYRAAARELHRIDAEIERRVAEKSRDIEAAWAQAEQAKREDALTRERERILADMHDGLGACLVGLLRHVQSAHAERSSIEQRVREALQEMRIAVHALQRRDGDLADVLGSLRHRVDDMLRGTEIRLVWDVGKLPDVGEPNHSALFAIQRILLEAVTNALQHSGAHRLRIAAHQHDAGVRICIEDDGAGFDPAQCGAGFGLANMSARAQSIGIRLEIHSRPGTGTAVVLTVPLRSPAAAI